MIGNVLKAPLRYGRENRTGPLYQYDYGQVLQFIGVDLPDVYEVHFSNQLRGESITQIGNADGVSVPDEMLLPGTDIYVWVFLHTGETDGETEYRVVIPVIARAKPTDTEPTPVQQDVITQAIAALNHAVDETAQSAEDAANYAEVAAEQAADARQSAEQASAAVTDVSGYATRAESARDRAVSAETNAQGSASIAAGSAAQAAQSASEADESADRAEQAAATAGYLDVEIDEHGHLIYLRTDAVDVDFVLDEGHLIMEVV